ncbi:kinetochore complex Sim4 subunit Fta1-domain-containing protein, partial [Coniella lustricola]
PPFLNTSFSTHRVSPLHIGAETLSQERLNVLSQRLRDLLVGDVVRGVEVGLDRAPDDGAMRRAGALESVAIGWVRLESLAGKYIGGESNGDANEDPDSSTSTVEAEAPPGRRRALQISMQYENTECAALLLPTLRDKSAAGGAVGDDSSILSAPGLNKPAKNDPRFLHLPLLLLRMPAPLKSVMTEFISRTFDCRISSLSLGTRSLVGALERWIRSSKIPTEGRFAKDIALTLGFHVPAIIPPRTAKLRSDGQGQVEDNDVAQATQIGIKTIDVVIPNRDLKRFLRAGERSEPQLTGAPADTTAIDTYGPVKRRKLGGDKDEESWTWRSDSTTATGNKHSSSSLSSSSLPTDDSSSSINTATAQDRQQRQPFIEALAKYLQKHLALDLFHPAVRVTKIACGGFVLSESRVKIF